MVDVKSLSPLSEYEGDSLENDFNKENLDDMFGHEKHISVSDFNNNIKYYLKNIKDEAMLKYVISSLLELYITNKIEKDIEDSFYSFFKKKN